MKQPGFQLVASLIAIVMIANLQYAWTLFVGPIRAAHGWQQSEVQAAFTLFILLQTFVQPLDGWLMDRMGPRVLISVAGILCGLGWSAMGYASSLTQLHVCYALAGVGAAFVYSGCIGSALKWYPDRRGFASGLIAAGFGSGSAVFNLVIENYLIPTYDYQGAFLCSGLVQGVTITVVAQFLRHPDASFALPKTAAATVTVQSRRNAETFNTREMLSKPQFYILYAMFVMVATGGLYLTANQKDIATAWGLSSIVSVIVVAGPIANGVSRIFWGWFSDRIGRENTMVIAFLLQAVCLVSVATLGRLSGPLFTIALVLTFFTWGEVYSLFPSTLGDYFGSKHATSNYAFLYTAKGVAAYLGAYLGTRLVERTGSWESVFYGSAVLAMAGGLTALVLKSRPLPKRATRRRQNGRNGTLIDANLH
ncbi:MAG: oxalate/formate MFS antiporter [Planctomycetes bacterium]|nr:oxalate/formate MFS antiporter [Planctomycetota bacterium]